MKKVERSFSNSVRMPYQDAIAFATRLYDFHIEQSIKDLKNKNFHEKQAQRMRNWITDMKEFIVSNESCHEREA
tara:strand:- start:1515 stop:1736 length:222 start_codon:yes stop_codon:yes gene_type:complete